MWNKRAELTGGAGQCYDGAAFGPRADGQALGDGPVSHMLIRIGIRAEARAELCGGQELAIGIAGRIGDRGEQALCAGHVAKRQRERDAHLRRIGHGGERGVGRCGNGFEKRGRLGCNGSERRRHDAGSQQQSKLRCHWAISSFQGDPAQSRRAGNYLLTSVAIKQKTGIVISKYHGVQARSRCGCGALPSTPRKRVRDGQAGRLDPGGGHCLRAQRVSQGKAGGGFQLLHGEHRADVEQGKLGDQDASTRHHRLRSSAPRS